MSTRQTILDNIKQISLDNGLTLAPNLSDETILLESGLDSLAFAILVATLEFKLGFDPFVIMDEPIYPKTLGDFIEIYERHPS
jgi:hypothetical protein